MIHAIMGEGHVLIPDLGQPNGWELRITQKIKVVVIFITYCRLGFWLFE